jgi:hypothetical protein
MVDSKPQTKKTNSLVLEPQRRSEATCENLFTIDVILMLSVH